MIWRSGASSFRPSQLMAKSTDDGVAIVGHKKIERQEITSVNHSIIGAVTDINDPAGSGGWTNLVALTGGPMMVVPRYEAASGLHLVEMVNTNNHAIRAQVLIDDVVVADIMSDIVLSSDGSGDIRPLYFDYNGFLGYLPIYCERSFTIRAAKDASFYSGEFVKITAIDFIYGDRR